MRRKERPRRPRAKRRMSSRYANVRPPITLLRIVTPLCLLALACASNTAAADELDLVRLDYRAPSGCPDEESFERSVTARSDRVRFVTQGETRSVTVSMAAANGSATGSIVWQTGALAPARREMSAGNCSELAEALAFALSLAVAPGSNPGKAHSIDDSSPPAAMDLSPPQAERPAPHDGASAAVSPLPSESSARPREPIGPPPAWRTTYRWDAGGSAEIASGVSPVVLVGASPYVGWGLPTRGVLAFELRAAWLRAASVSIETPVGAASFTWTVGRLDACGTIEATRRPHPLRGRLCARAEGGALDVRASVPGGIDRTRGWFAAGAVLGASWEVLSPLRLEIDGAAMVRATADRFYVLPDVTAYTVPYLGLEASAGLGAHFR